MREDRRISMRTSCFWRPAGVIYLLFCLAGLAAGLWPEAICPPAEDDFAPAVLPTLATLAMGQVVFLLLVYPVVHLFRSSRDGEGGTFGLGASIVETLGLFVMTVPFYFAAGWLGDATEIDVLRTAIVVATICPISWLAGRLLVLPAMRTAVLLALLIVAVGLPCVFFLFRDFYPHLPADWLWDLCPTTFVANAAVARNPSLLPQPFWPLLFWSGLAVGGALLKFLRPAR